jgi:uncharacterized protein YyaL (SSP411 family)
VSTKGVLGIAPHFEKMLYDNAQLARVYLHWQVAGDAFYCAIAEETLDYVIREMRLEMGVDLTHIIRGGTVRRIA